jgi:hypothetical protein
MQEHPMTAQAIGGAILFVQGGLLLAAFLQYRDRQRMQRIATVAYRSLAQAANDAGRRLLAPLNGADLYELGIPPDLLAPGQSGSIVEEDRARLRANGFDVSFAEPTGSWRPQRPLLEERLPPLLDDPRFVRRLFRVASRARRDVQDYTARWAPTMLVDSELTDDLGRLRRLTDALEQLLERLRASGLMSVEVSDWTAPPGFADLVAAAFWDAIKAYEELRTEFGDLADLPSDSWVDRNRVRSS